tara:strand:- start:1269 stop:1583 length:315 start_codon:yes stop_codon:yes gene_type:complete
MKVYARVRFIPLILVRYGRKKTLEVENMKLKEEDYEKIRLAVQRLRRIGGSCASEHIGEVMNGGMEIEGVILGIQYGEILRYDDRIFVSPDLLYSLCAREEGVN